MVENNPNSLSVSDIPPEVLMCKRETIEWGARKLNVDPNFMGGVILSESGGGGFVNNKLVIRFEAHYFNNFTSFKYKDYFSYNQKKNWLDQKYREDVNSNNWEWIHPSKNQQNQEHKVFNFAKRLDEDAAYKSISMGLGQIMGNNYKAAGYNSAKEMYEDFCKGEGQQIKGMINFISSKKTLHTALRNGDFTTFVKEYNGPGQVDIYKEKFKKNIEIYKEPNCKLCKYCKKKNQ